MDATAATLIRVKPVVGRFDKVRIADFVRQTGFAWHWIEGDFFIRNPHSAIRN
jgi:hypothetical protein